MDSLGGLRTVLFIFGAASAADRWFDYEPQSIPFSSFNSSDARR